MQNKTEKKFFNIEKDTKSWYPVNRNGWWIKFSTYSDTNILLLFTSEYTGQTILRYFTDENEAVQYINFIVNCDPQEEFPNKYLPE